MCLSVQRLSSVHRREVVQVLDDSFRDYPVMRFVLSDAGERYDAHLTALNDFFCDRRLADGGWVLGVRVDGELAGVAVLDAPEDDPGSDPEGHRRRVLRLVSAIGAGAVERLKIYDAAGDSLTPSGDYHYLGMLGVLERCQGLGIGRQLVEATQELAVASEISTGVCLHTETEKNVPLYEHLGFEVVGQADIAGLTTWCMMWRVPGRG